MLEEVEWFFDNFDLEVAAEGKFEPTRGVDEQFDSSLEAIERIEAELQDYKEDICANVLRSSSARSNWKYVNTKPDSRDKYLIELPANVSVPDDFILKGKRGKGFKQVNKYRTQVVEELVQELEQALDTVAERKARGMELIFAKFDSMRDLWGAASQAISMLDALNSLAKTASQPGYSRPTILECPPDTGPSMTVVQGRHPCVEGSAVDSSSDFVPNDLSLGSESSSERVLLLSGPNMGGTSDVCLFQCGLIILWFLSFILSSQIFRQEYATSSNLLDRDSCSNRLLCTS